MVDVEAKAARRRLDGRCAAKRSARPSDDLVAMHPGYEWRSVNGVIHVRPPSAFANFNHFPQSGDRSARAHRRVTPASHLPSYRVFIPDCVVSHPIYTDQRDAFLKTEDLAMRRW
jgi:hypothetical protein